MNKHYFKYELRSGGDSMFTPRDLNWLERFKYRLSGYKVIKMDDAYWESRPVDNTKKTIVNLEIKY